MVVAGGTGMSMLEVQARIYGSNGGSFNGPAGTNKLKWGYSSSVSD